MCEYVVSSPDELDEYVYNDLGDFSGGMYVGERVTRCVDCGRAASRDSHLYCTGALWQASYVKVAPDDFCSRGFPREA